LLERQLSATQTGFEIEKQRVVLGGWSGLVKKIETALPRQHLDFATVLKDLKWLVLGDAGLFGVLSGLAAAAKNRGLDDLEALLEPFVKLTGMPLEWGAGLIVRAVRAAWKAGAAIIRFDRVAMSASAAPTEAEGAEAVAGLAALETALAALARVTAPAIIGGLAAVGTVTVGEEIYRFGIKGSRLEGWLASHLHDERSDVHLRRWEMHRGGTNTFHVTHAPQITVVVNGAEAAHPRKIAEQMVMALQSHHSELDQKLADAWKRQSARDERTGF
jgi:hypothetical protein